MDATTFGEPEPRDELHADPQPLRLTRPFGDAHRRRVVDLGVGDAFGRGDLVRVTVVDANGDPVARGLATVDVGPDPADRLTVRFVDLVLPGRQLLPVRPERHAEPVTLPDGSVVDFTVPLADGNRTAPDPRFLFVGDPPPTYRHQHLHPHTFPDDPLRAQYHHAHRHAHPGDARRAHGPGDDGDAALHDHHHDVPAW